MSYPVKPIPRPVIDAAMRIGGEDVVEILTLASVETNGTGCEDDGTPVFLCEPYRFWKALPADLRNRALKSGLAAKKWSRSLYKDQGTYAARSKRLAGMAALDVEAAYRSISMGLGQVMGDHAAECGYSSAKAMFDSLRGNVDAQLRAMAKVAADQGVIAALKAHDYKKAAKAYNGTEYRTNRYDEKLAAAHAHWDCAVATGQYAPPTAPNTLGLGSFGTAVAAIQSLLTRAGVPTKADGNYGPETIGSVAKFRAKRGLTGPVALLDQPTADAIATAAASAPIPKGAREVIREKAAAQVSAVVAKARQVKLTGIGAFFASVFAAAKAFMANLDDLKTQAVDWVGQDTVDAAVAVARHSPWILGALGVSALVYVLGHSIARTGTDDVATGNTVGAEA